MATLTVPSSGLVYVDSVVLIYSVERYPSYWPLLQPLWLAAQAGGIEVVSSELIILETLVGPLKSANASLEKAFEEALFNTELRLLPITQTVLREAARLRALGSLRTPDALHAATALQSGCASFLTNDLGFRHVAGLPVTILQDLLAP